MKQIAKWFSSLALAGLFAVPWTAAAATVPTLTVDEDHVTATTAPLSWTACDNVVNYTVQLASDTPIVVGGSGGSVTVFGNAANTPDTPPVGWQYNIANGSASSGYLQLTAAGHYVVSDICDTEACVNMTLSFKIRTYGGTDTGSTNLLVQYSVNDGSTWTDLGTAHASSTTLTTKSLNASAAIGHPSVRFRFSVPEANGKGLGINTFELTGTEKSAAGNVIRTLTVSGTSTTLTGLAPESYYGVRVKGHGEWSGDEAFITLESSGSGEAPSIAAIADQTYVYGANDGLFSLTVAASGDPAPTFSVASADAPEGYFDINSSGVFSFMPSETGTFHFTVTATNGVSPDATASFTVAVTGTAPALAAIADRTKVLGTGDVELTASATGNPAPTYSVSSSDAPADSFDIDETTGFFYFTPAATGIFHFTVTAANSVSTASQSFSVTVTSASVPAPVLTISNETDTTADASWTAVSGASAYTLQLASDEHFTGGLLAENFSKIAASNSTAVANFDNVTQTAGWSGEYAYPHPGALRMGNSSKAGSLQTPALTASGSITVSWTAWRWDGDTPTVAVGVSEDGGTTFSEQTVALTDTATAYSHTFALSGSSAIVRWRATAASKKRFFLDDISVTASSGSLISSTTTSSTAYTFTGLDPETIYYGRVKADDGEWSSVVDFITDEASGTAPAITAIADQTYVYGSGSGDFELTVTATGDPAPEFSVASSDAPAGNFEIDENTGFFFFTPAATGTFHFTVTAANGVSPAAAASFAVTVTGTAPSISAIPDQTKVLGTGDVELTASATGNPAPTYSVASSDAPAGSFDIDDATGFFFFTPAATGTFHFTVTASNSVSTASRSFTVTVTPASVPAPTLTISNETDTTADASWTAVSGASSYTLQLGSDEHFTPGPGYAEDFTSFPSASSYATNSQTVASGTWAYDGAKFAPGGAANGEGSKGNTTLRANGTLDLPAIDHPSKVSVAARVSSGTGALNLQQYASGSWSTIATWTLSSTGTVFSHTLDGNGSAVALRLTGAKVTTIYDVAVASADGSLLEEITTASTSHAFTGLTPDELYCARVKADDGDWSTTVMFATEEPAGTAPSITAIADQTYVYGATEGIFTLNVAASGTPAPTFSVASSDAPEGYFGINPTSGLFEFMPLATGTFHFTVTASNGVSPAATASFAVTVTGTAPSVTPIADKTITLEDGGTEFQIAATGNPPPVFSATSTTAPAGSYGIDASGVFTFIPEAEGTFFFVVTASNSVASSSIAFAITVAPSVAPVPELTVTNIAATSADASWTAITGALSYTLQLGTDDDFAPASGYAEDFSAFASSSYSSELASQTVSSGTWSYEYVRMTPGGATNGVGSKGYAQLQASNGHLYLPSIDNPAKLTVVARASGGALTLQQQVGATWTTIDSYTLEPTGTAHTHTFANAGTSVALRLVAGANATYVYDVSVVSDDGTLVEEVTIPGWSHTFTNLSPSTLYFARVKADNSEWSEVERFETAAPAGSAPVWSSIPAQTVLVGQDCDIDLADYVSGSAPITIGMADTEYDAVLIGTAFSFTPGAVGTFTFTFTAANDFGTSNATLTVTATGDAPVVTVTPATYAYNVTVGDPDVEFTVTASGNPAPVLSDSCTEGAFYLFENNAFLFETDTAGTYHFVFTATNSEGSDSKTVTVTVSDPSVEIPVLTISGETATTADASWTACTGVTAYTLQLATNNQFTVGAYGQLFAESFDKVTTTSQTAIPSLDSATDVSGWSGTNAYPQSGALRLGKGSGAGVLQTPPFEASTTLRVVWSGCSWTNDNTHVYVGVSANGSVFDEKEVTLTESMDFCTNTFDLAGTSSVVVRWRSSKASNQRFFIDNIAISGNAPAGSGSGSLVFDGQVAGTNYTFTGLSPDTIYYARVKGGSYWSPVVDFLTDEGSSPAPGAPELVIHDPYSGKFQVLNFSSDRYYQLLYTTDLRPPLEEYETLDLGWGPSSGEFWHDFPPVDGDWFGGLRVTPTAP